MPEKILKLISLNPSITIAELATATELNSRTIERNLKTLQAQSRLRRIGPDKGGSWELSDP